MFQADDRHRYQAHPLQGQRGLDHRVMAGDVQMTIVDTPPLVPQISAGRF